MWLALFGILSFYAIILFRDGLKSIQKNLNVFIMFLASDFDFLVNCVLFILFLLSAGSRARKNDTNYCESIGDDWTEGHHQQRLGWPWELLSFSFQLKLCMLLSYHELFYHLITPVCQFI